MEGYHNGDVVIFDINNIGIVIDGGTEDITIEELSTDVIRVRNARYDTNCGTMKKVCEPSSSLIKADYDHRKTVNLLIGR